MVKWSLYIIVLPFMVWLLDSVQLNALFKKNRVLQARFFYIVIVFILSYLLVNFIYDFIGVINL